MNKFRHQAVLILFLVAGLGSQFCDSVYAQATRPVVHVRFQWTDPENKFSGVDSHKQAIETAVTREVSTRATQLYSVLEWTTEEASSTPGAGWIVELKVEPRELTPRSGPQKKWWRVRLNHYLKRGDVSKLITSSDEHILYDFDDFPPFDDAITLHSDLVSKVYEQFSRHDVAMVIYELAFETGDPQQVPYLQDLAELLDDSGLWQEASAEFRMELPRVVSEALSRMDVDPVEFMESGLRDRLMALGEDPVIGVGVDEIVELYDLTRRILTRIGTDEPLEANMDQVEARDRPDQDPSRRMSLADGFGELVRSLGSLMKQEANALSGLDQRSDQYYRFAESFYRLAADLHPSEVDPAAVRELVRLKVEMDELPAVEQLRTLYKRRIVETEGSALSSNRLKKTFEYHKTLGGLYTRLSDWGDASQAPAAVYHLEQARRNSYQLEDQLGGELPDAYRFSREMSAMLDRACNAGGNCWPSDPAPPTAVTQDYIGDDIRLAVGYDSETDLTGELFWNFLEDSDSAGYSFEGWKGADSSGGVKLNFHWLADGVLAGEDVKGKPVYSDGKVRKVFIAADRNVFDDGKLTFGGGGERHDRFWSVYASTAMTGERFLRQAVKTVTEVETDVINNHLWTWTDTVTTTTGFFAHPYDWGVGFRIGMHFDGALVRLRGGLDYESGDYSSSQATAFIGLDKRFEGTGHGISLRAEYLRKQGDFETDRDDVRLSAYWSWDFGTTFRPSGTVPVECIVDPFALPAGEADGVEAAWIRRALRNPAAHKRSVDFYRYNRVTEEHDPQHFFEIELLKQTDEPDIEIEEIISIVSWDESLEVTNQTK